MQWQPTIAKLIISMAKATQKNQKMSLHESCLYDTNGFSSSLSSRMKRRSELYIHLAICCSFQFMVKVSNGETDWALSRGTFYHGCYFLIFLSQAITAGVLLLLAHKEWTQRYLVNMWTLLMWEISKPVKIWFKPKWQQLPRSKS